MTTTKRSGPRLGIESHRNATVTTPYGRLTPPRKEPVFQRMALAALRNARTLDELNYERRYWSFLQGFHTAGPGDDPGAQLEEIACAYTRRYLELVEAVRE